MALAEKFDDDATAFKAKSRPKGDASLIDFAPLSDMTFQLLAFFVMTVRLANQESVDVPLISHGQGVELTTATVFTILAPPDAKSEARMLLGNGKEGTQVTLDDARTAIENSVRTGKPNIIIKAEKTVTTGVVQQLSRVVAAVSGAELFIGVADTEQ
jgi:biopolymer transport protein ExbD